LLALSVASAPSSAAAAPATSAPAVATPATATPATVTQATSRSDALIEQGMQLRREGKDEEALTIFAEAASLDPESVRARVHLAAAHQALGHWLEAEALLADLLQEADDAYVERHRATLLLAQEFVGRHLGTLLIAGQPEGAVVKVDGRSLGTLPLTKALRLAVGSYQLEVTRPGYYPLQRPIDIGAGSTLRESLALAPLAEAAPAAPEPAAAGPSAAGPPRWLAWSLTGLAAGGAVATGVAWGVRNHHAAHWNSDACLQPGRLRGEVCPGERDDGKRAEQLAYVGGVATLLLVAGAAVSWTLPPPSDAPAVTALSCGFTLGVAACAGSF
jgi:hypothetical protein